MLEHSYLHGFWRLFRYFLVFSFMEQPRLFPYSVFIVVVEKNIIEGGLFCVLPTSMFTLRITHDTHEREFVVVRFGLWRTEEGERERGAFTALLEMMG